MDTFSVLDYAIFIAYAFLILFVPIFNNTRISKNNTCNDFFPVDLFCTIETEITMGY